MFQKKIDKPFNGMPNVFSIADDIVIALFDELDRDNDATLDQVIRLYRQANLKLNKDKYLLRCTSIPFFSDVISWQSISSDPRKKKALTDMPPPTSKRELQSFLGILDYLSNFSPVTDEVHELLWKLTSVKAEWLWNKMYQDL